MKRIANILRKWAELLDPTPHPLSNKPYNVTVGESEGTVIETTAQAVWNPEQHGNVIVVEPMLVTKDRLENGKL